MCNIVNLSFYHKIKLILLRDKFVYFNVLVSIINLLFINRELINKFSYSGFSSILYLEATSLMVISPFVGMTSAYVARVRISNYHIGFLKAISFTASLIFIFFYIVTSDVFYLFLTGTLLNFDFYFIRNNKYEFVFYKNVIQKSILFLSLFFIPSITCEFYIIIYSITLFSIGLLSYWVVFRNKSLIPDWSVFIKFYKVRSYFLYSSMLNIVQSFFSSSTVFFLKLFGFSDFVIGQVGIIDKIAKSSLLFISPLAIASSNRLKQLSIKNFAMIVKMLRVDFLLVGVLHAFTVIFLLHHFYYNSILGYGQKFLYVSMGIQYFIQTIFLQLYFLNRRAGILKYFYILSGVGVCNVFLIYLFKIYNLEILSIIWLQEFMLFLVLIITFKLFIKNR